MDKLPQRLKDDAAAIEARPDPERRARLDAQLRATPRAAVHGEPQSARRVLNRASIIAGLAASALFIAFLNRAPEPPLADVPAIADVLPHAGGLRVEQVRLTGPLQAELDRLRADMERARDIIERDLRTSL